MYSAPVIHGHQTLGTISLLDTFGSVISFGVPASGAYLLANLALYIPFSVSEMVTAYEGWVATGTTAGGNFDIGIYSAAGARLTSAGATARNASAIDNTAAMADQVLLPSVRYYMAFSASGVDAYQCKTDVAGIYEACGVLESTSSFVLPSSPTLSRTTRAYMPLFGLNFYTVSM